MTSAALRRWLADGRRSLGGPIAERWLLLAVIAVVAGWTFHCRHSGTLRIAIPDGLEAIGFEKIVEDYGRSYDGRIEIVELPYEKLYERVLAAVRCGEPSLDLILVDDPWLPMLIEPPSCPKAGAASGLTLLQLSKDERDELVRPLRGCGRVIGRKEFEVSQEAEQPCGGDEVVDDGAYYALPFVGNSQLYLHPKGNRPWPDLMEALARAPEPNGAVEPHAGGASEGRIEYALRLGRGNSIVTDFISILWYFEGREASAPGQELRPLSERALPALRAFHRLTKPLRFGERLPDDYDVAAYVGKGLATDAIVWSSWVMAMANVDSNTASQWSRDTVTEPSVDEAVPPVLGTWVLAIPLSSRNPSEARELLLHAMEKKQLCTAAWFGNPPPRSVDHCASPEAIGHRSDLTSHYPTLEAQAKSLRAAIPRPRSPNWKRFENKLGACLFELSTLDEVKDEALCAIRKEINRSIEAAPGSPGERGGSQDESCAWQQRPTECTEKEWQALRRQDR